MPLHARQSRINTRPAASLLLVLLLVGAAVGGQATSGAPASEETGPSPAEFSGISADGLLRTIERFGAREVLGVVCLEVEAWRSILDRIGSGEELWLQAGGLLYEFADASCGIDLMLAISSALPKAPERVLALPRSQISARARCADGGPEMGPLHPIEFYQEAIDAVSAVDDPSLQAMRDECLAIMRAIVAPPAEEMGTSLRKGEPALIR